MAQEPPKLAQSASVRNVRGAPVVAKRVESSYGMRAKRPEHNALIHASGFKGVLSGIKVLLVKPS